MIVFTIQWPRDSEDTVSNMLGETEHKLDIIFIQIKSANDSGNDYSTR